MWYTDVILLYHTSRVERVSRFCRQIATPDIEPLPALDVSWGCRYDRLG